MFQITKSGLVNYTSADLAGRVQWQGGLDENSRRQRRPFLSFAGPNKESDILDVMMVKRGREEEAEEKEGGGREEKGRRLEWTEKRIKQLFLPIIFLSSIMKSNSPTNQ